jgi:hypothetical protein
MFKVIGAITVMGGLAFGVAYFNGYIVGQADVQVTDKGRQAASDGLHEVQSGISKGLDAAADAVAPQAPSK